MNVCPVITPVRFARKLATSRVPVKSALKGLALVAKRFVFKLNNLNLIAVSMQFIPLLKQPANVWTPRDFLILL